MYGSSNESSGCVLRGALSLKLNKPTRLKSLSLCFLGKISVSWNQLGNGYERKFNDHRTVISHKWTFLSTQQNKTHLLSTGTHTFEFELVLPGSLPESTRMDKYYNVDYRLKAVAEKPAFSRDYVARRDIHLSRQKPNITNEFFDPIHLVNRWENKLEYEISLPTKVYTYGDYIPVKIKLVSLIPHLHINYVSCIFKEYLTCRAINGWFNGKNKSQRRLIEYTRKNTDRQELKMDSTWTATVQMHVPESVVDIQCDAHNDSVQVQHKIKLNLTIEDKQGRLYVINITLPIIIAITDSIGVLPSYEDIWQTLPYDPTMMLDLSTDCIPPSYRSIIC
ncbi:hypothetical protein G6F22_011655 [Rhizopus arrhizus]|nr:hypothetical protein G6F22_011655 [Rhizopus arrhizus]KAG1214307.1 hypothetical protein G6F35_010185 [Rhizopus arrhizus]